MRAVLKGLIIAGTLAQAAASQAACDQLEYNRQYSTLRNIWMSNYQNNCMQADGFLAQFGRPVVGLSSCRVDSRNAATIDFANWVRQACVNGCEQAGEGMGKQLGLQIAAQVCHLAPSQAPRQHVSCNQRVVQFCLNGLQDTVASLCPQALNTYAYQQGVSDCYNWAQ